MNERMQDHQDYRFMIGLVTGTFIGAGLAMWFVPRSASECGHRMSNAAKNLGAKASERYQQASTRVGEAVDELTRRGQELRDDVADAVAHGAHEVERYATAAKSARVAEDGTHSGADRSAATPHSL